MDKKKKLNEVFTLLYSSLGLSFVISYTSIMAYSLLKSILIAVKCINILKNNTESSIFTFFLLSQKRETWSRDTALNLNYIATLH